MIGHALTALAVAQSVDTPTPELMVDPGSAVHFYIPAEIAPAVEPYLERLIASRGIDPRAAAKVGVSPGSDCLSQREEAERQADDMLRRSGTRDAARRRAIIDATMDGANRFVLPSPAPTTNGTRKDHAEDR
jgi:hypothetical protein